MAIIHFVWWGPYKGKISVETPNTFARICPDHEIRFWCRYNAYNAFREKLDRDIRLEQFNEVERVVGHKLFRENEWFKQAQSNLVYFQSVKAFAAAKDLASLILMYAHGGYFFDTTTAVTPGAPERALNNALTQGQPNAPRVPNISDRSPMSHLLGIQTAMAIVTGQDFDVASRGDEDAKSANLVYTVPHIDVWAMYSPPLHPCFELAIYSYVSRCNRLGLYYGGKPHNFSGIDGNKIMTSDDRTWRNDLIGNLVTYSLLDGLLVECCKYDEKKFAEFCWTATHVADQKHYRLQNLHLDKHYRNSWRM